jgi:hypothetical protein
VLEATEVIVAEVSLFEFFVGGPVFADVVGALKDKGFALYDIYGGHLRPLDGALAQIDAVFVRGVGRFRTTHAYATREQRQARDRA